MKKLILFSLIFGAVGSVWAAPKNDPFSRYVFSPRYSSSQLGSARLAESKRSLESYLEHMLTFAVEKGNPIKANMALLSGSDTANLQHVFDRTMLALGYKKEWCIETKDINPFSLRLLSLYVVSSYMTVVFEREQKDSTAFDFEILLYPSFWMNKRIHAKLYLWNSRTETMIVRKFKSKPDPNPAADLVFCFYNRRFR